MKSNQIGGSHYEAEYQHWDWAIDVRLGYLESAASKYAFRWYKKNGIEDLDKARSYLLKAKECFLEGRWNNQCLHVDTWPLARDKAETLFGTFADSAGLPDIEADLCLSIAQWRNDADLSIIIDQISTHIEAAQTTLDAGGTLGPLAPLNALHAAKTGGSGCAGGATTQTPTSSTSTEVADKGSSHPFPFGYVPGDL